MENPETQGGTRGNRPENGQGAAGGSTSARETGRRAQQGASQQGERRSELAPRSGEHLPARRAQHPFAMMAQLSEEMDRLMDSFFGRSWLARTGLSRRGGAEMETWYPKIEVRERDNELVVCAELPGIRKEDVNIEVDEGQVVISGERREESESKERGLYRSERSYGSFYRAIPLPEGAQTEKVRATMRDGVLELTVPMQQKKQQQRRIQIEG